MPTRSKTALTDSPQAIAAVDDILAAAGLAHGSRATRRDSWAAGERRLTGTKQLAADRARVAIGQKLQPLESALLSKQTDLTHAFSTRTGGSSRVFRANQPNGEGDLNLGFTEHDEAEAVRENRRRFLETIGAENFKSFALLQQKHTPNVRILRSIDEPQSSFLEPAQMRGDGLLTDVPGILLTIQTADCIPVLLFDPVHRAIGALHAGWRGTLARIVERAVGSMRLLYGSNPKDILAAIAPGIGPESYAVGEELRHEFESQFAYAPTLFRDVYDSDPIREKYPMLFLTARAPGHSPIGPQLHLDLWAANRQQLLDAGLFPENIDTLAQDTATNTGRFFSYRAENGFTGRMMAAIGLN